MKQSLLTTTLLAGVVALAGCGGNGNDSQSAGSEAPEPDDVVARVNGEAISATALDAQIQAQSKQGQPASKQQALDRLVDLVVLAQKAEENGLPQQPEIAAKIKRQRASILAQHLVRVELSDFEPSEDELRKAYEEQTSGEAAKEYKASHILVEEEAKANDMIAQLDDGAEFAALAKEHSTGPTGKRGGSLGWFEAGQMVEPFNKALQELEPGNYSEAPVKTRFGWHVVRLEDVRTKEKPKFEDMKSELRNQLVSQHVQDYITSLREDAEIETNLSDDSNGGSGNEGSGDSGSGDNGGESDSGGSSGGAY